MKRHRKARRIKPRKIPKIMADFGALWINPKIKVGFISVYDRVLTPDETKSLNEFLSNEWFGG